MGEKHEQLKAAIREILAKTPLDELIKYGIAAKLPRDLAVTPYRTGQVLQQIRKEENQASEPAPDLPSTPVADFFIKQEIERMVKVFYKDGYSHGYRVGYNAAKEGSGDETQTEKT